MSCVFSVDLRLGSFISRNNPREAGWGSHLVDLKGTKHLGALLVELRVDRLGFVGLERERNSLAK